MTVMGEIHRAGWELEQDPPPNLTKRGLAMLVEI
jgi:hypothetical protein